MATMQSATGAWVLKPQTMKPVVAAGLEQERLPSLRPTNNNTK